jgi:hypothetical protein
MFLCLKTVPSDHEREKVVSETISHEILSTITVVACNAARASIYSLGGSPEGLLKITMKKLEAEATH